MLAVSTQHAVHCVLLQPGEGGGGANDVTEDGRREEKEETVEDMREGNPSPETHHHG